MRGFKKQKSRAMVGVCTLIRGFLKERRQQAAGFWKGNDVWTHIGVDVQRHVHSYVCPHVVAFPKSGRLLPPFLQKSPYERAHTHHRPRLLFLEAPHPVTTSTREILLSP